MQPSLVPIYIDESTRLTEVIIQQAQSDNAKDKEVEQPQEKVLEKVLEQTNTQVSGQKLPPMPFPQRLAKNKIDDQYKKFMDMLRQVQLNIPLIDALR